MTSLAPLFGLLLCAANGGGFSKLRVWLADAPWNGLRASTLAAAIATALALVLGHALARQARVGVWVDGLATLAFILPSSVLGVGIVAAWNHPSTSWLYGSYAVLVVGFVARYTAVATRMFAGAVAQLPASFEEAAKSVGAGYLRRLHLVQQLAARGLAATFVLTLVFALRDLETAALFYPPSGEPLTVRIFTLEANGPPAIGAALALVHVAITLAAVSGGFILLRDRRAA